MSTLINRRELLAALMVLEPRATCSVWVFGLLHPTRLNLYPDGNARLHVGTRILEGRDALTMDAARTPMTVTGPQRRPVAFVLEIPGVIRRRYFGTLTVTSHGRLLRPIVTMDREVAVGSIVGAELPVQGTPIQALAAQAVAARSFLRAEADKQRHGDAQFCDTTHCQFLRAPALADSAVGRAVSTTKQFVVVADGVVIPGHYSAACGGHTDTGELDHYLYRSVVCEPCREAGVKRRGHGLGLCQTGAVSLARQAWEFGRILEKYYPGAAIQSS